MPNSLKDLYTPEFFICFGEKAENCIPGFQLQDYLDLTMDNSWHSLELKQRMRKAAVSLKPFMPLEFQESFQVYSNLIPAIMSDNTVQYSGLLYMFLADYIEVFGIEHPDYALDMMEILTPLASCEFAIRPFIVKYPERVIPKLMEWTKHPNEHVRRLASEGSRPSLPWAMALPDFKKNPFLILPILENLMQDESEYVRRSVANSLNDISKLHPDLVIDLAEKWVNGHLPTIKLMKHACRTLLKQGNERALKVFGISFSKTILISNFRIQKSEIQVGERLDFEFTIKNVDSKEQKIRLEYVLYFLLQNNSYGKKVFQISELVLPSKQKLDFKRNHSFRIMTTRKYYQGIQKIGICVNGKEMDLEQFQLRATD
jgi:3-methyladenine DNA glycosylase AlkC